MGPILALLLAGGAQAQEEVCPGPLTPAYWREAMDAVDGAISEFNGERANRILDDILFELRCLEEPAAPADIGRLARRISLMAFYEQDAAETEAWALLARQTVGGRPWPAALPVPDAYHQFVAELPEDELATVDGRGLVPPARGAVLLDGRLLTGPTASLGTSHLVQLVDKKGLVFETRWQDGAAFAEELLGQPGTVKPPRWYSEPPAPQPVEPWVAPAEEDAVVDAEEVAAELEDAAELAEVDAGPTGARARRRTIAVAEEERARMFESKDLQEGCPWKKEPKNAEARGGRVTVNKHSYPVKTAEEQAIFRQVLRQCGELRAARRFTRWREAKKKLALDARTYREAMIKALLTEEGKRRRKQAGGAEEP